jgi:hypothetical protein
MSIDYSTWKVIYNYFLFKRYCNDAHPKRGSVGSVTTTQLEGESLGTRDTTVRVKDSVETLRIARTVREGCKLMKTLFSMN